MERYIVFKNWKIIKILIVLIVFYILYVIPMKISLGIFM
jgi:hypothetical protein